MGTTRHRRPFAVQVQDSFGNPVTNAGAAVTLSLSSTSTGTRPFFTPTNGGARPARSPSPPAPHSSSNFYYSDTKAGAPTINLAGATVNGQAVTGTSTNGFTMVAGNANKFVFTTAVAGNQAASSTATVGPFVVQVQDSFGNPVTNAGTAVTLNLSTTSTGTTGHAPFFTTTNGGAAAGAVTIPNGASSSTFYYSDTKPGTPTINLAGATVNAQAVTGTSTNGFTMVVGNANKLVFTTTVSGNHSVGATATVGPFAVQVQDQFGNPVANAGAPVTLLLSSSSTGTTFFTPTSGGAAAGAVTIATGASTSSNFFYSDTKAGAPTISASATVNTFIVSGTTNGFTMVAGAENKLAITTQPPVSVGAGTSFTVGVTVEDQFGNTITTGAGSTDNIHVALSSGSFSAGTTTVTAAAGVATFNGLQMTAPGSYTITASDTTTGTVTAATTNSFTVTAGPPSKLVFTTTVSGNHTVGNTATVGPFVVQVQDSFGNPVANTGGPVTLTLSSNSTGTTFFTPTSGGAAAGAVTIATGASTSTFYYSDTKAGTPTITLAGATVNGQAVTGATTNGFTMVAGNANKFAFTTTVAGNHTVGTTATVGPFVVQVQDSFGNPVTNAGAAVTLSLSSTSTGTTGHAPFFTTTNGGAAAGAVTIATGASSSSNFYYSDTKAGTPTINLAGATVNAQAVTGTSTNGFTIVAGNAATLSLSAASTTPAAGAGDDLTITALDAFGNTATSYTGAKNLTFGGANAIGTFNPTVTNTSATPVNFATVESITFAGGVASPATGGATGQAVMKLYQAGSDLIVVTDGTINNNASPLSVTVSATPANKFAFTSTVAGNKTVGITATVGPFVVQVQDQFGNPITNAGAAVTLTLSTSSAGTTGHAPFFTPTNGGAAAGAVTIGTGASSSPNFYYSDTLANAPTITLGGATVNGQAVTGTTTNGFTMVAGAENKLAITTQPPVSVGAGTSFTVGVTVEDQFGNTVTTGAGSTDQIHVALSSGSFSAGTTTVTAAAGVATFNGLQITAPASYTITASDTTTGTVTSATTNSFTVIPVLAATSVASKTGTTATSDTTTAFTTVNADTYVITAFEATSAGNISVPTPTVSGGEAVTIVAGSTNNFGGNSSPNCTAHRCQMWAWTFKATSSASQTVSITFTGTPQYTAIDVLHLTLANTTTPIVAAATSMASNSSNSATANLATGATAGDLSLEIVASDRNEGSSALTWVPATGVSTAFQNGTNTGSLGVYVTSPAVQNESTSTTGWSGNDWGTIALEVQP